MNLEPRLQLCAVPGCRSRVEPEHLMCRRCWRCVPEKLQAAVYEAHSAMMNTIHLPRIRRLRAVKQYRNARDAAVAAVRMVNA